MRAGIEVLARRWWEGELGAAGRLAGVAAAPLAWAWAEGTALVLRRRSARVVRVEGGPVLSVGNLAVGGTGKTPMTAWIAARLDELDARPAIVVGGQGADEAMLHRRRLPAVPVLEGRDRVAGARRALAEGAGAVVLDDGFQHPELERDLDVVLLAAEDSFPGAVLPAGPYRERPAALSRADVALITRRTASREESRALADRVRTLRAGLPTAAVELGAGAWVHLDGSEASAPTGDILAVSAIARPSAFRRTVASVASGSVEAVAFADHHGYTPADVTRLARRARGRTVVTTEKDAVKLQWHRETLGDALVLTEHVRWDWGEDLVMERLRGLAGVVAG